MSTEILYVIYYKFVYTSCRCVCVVANADVLYDNNEKKTYLSPRKMKRWREEGGKNR